MGVGQKRGPGPEGDQAAGTEGLTTPEVGCEDRATLEVNGKAEPPGMPQTQEAESLAIYSIYIVDSGDGASCKKRQLPWHPTSAPGTPPSCCGPTGTGTGEGCDPAAGIEYCGEHWS